MINLLQKTPVLLLFCLTLSLQSCGQNKPTKSTKTNQTMNNTNLDTITLAGGCYWCTEAVFQRLDGVVSIESGFTGGAMKNPSYRDVCTGNTGHAECVQITYDKTKTSLDEIFKVFFTVHDPTTLNRQGNDAGTQYRSGIFYRNEEQKKAAEDIIKALTEAKIYSDPIVTEVTPFTVFYKAEDYHQDYYNQNGSQPYCQIVIRPKVEKFEKLFKDRIKK
jgi:methionine-S-sulfoxide reductase